MVRMDATACLELWEAGRGLHPLDRGLLAIHRTFPATRGEDVADWPIGDRNRLLARLQCVSFGPRLEGMTTCPECREQLEFTFDAAQLAAQPPTSEATVTVAHERFRLPTSRDLASVVDAEDAAMRLALRCRLALPSEPESEDRTWSETDLERIGEQLALADPCAEILLDFDCPQCHSGFRENLDLAAFLWSELDARARRLLREVHALAGAYGWNEGEILALAPARRAAYLEMVWA
ncbi:hypothetical protein [Variovorax sp. dw_954]|uniref:T4 family baseplate hub assembly chaperone n=1 Tax=Variovorax sp. dw_954 TaxID=2720078 RepID=UPI001BD4E936|nr:hypothetical protein [Variovorax sp. dw_954]